MSLEAKSIEGYPIQVRTRKSFGLMPRKLSGSESRTLARSWAFFELKTERGVFEFLEGRVTTVANDK